MGSFDCYCALCAGPLNIGVMEFGSRRPKALEKRRRRVAAEDTEDEDEDEEMEDADKTVSDEDDKAPVLPNPFAKQEEPSWGDDIESDLDFEADEENPAFSSDSESFSDSDPDLFLGDITDVSHRPLTPDPRTLRDPDCWSQWSDPSIYEGFDPYDTNGEDSYREKNSYDPYKLQADDVRWIDRCRCLAFNPNAPGVTKAYISGRGRYDDYGSFDVRRPGSDPNDDHDRTHTCFFAFSPDESSSFPFHEECYRILAKALEHKRYQDIDKDVLYGVMAAHTPEYGRALDISYGGISGGEQFWMCISGEEYAVCDPGLRIGLEDVLQGMLPARLFDGNLHFPDLSHKARHDPLSVMPYDVLLNIFKHVCTDDMLALMNASTHVSEMTRNRSFWKHMLHLRILPWFWELSTLLENTTLTETFNYKGLFIWINRITTPKYGMEGPLMGIANRRRIWESCKAIAPEYRKQLPSAPRSGPEEDEARAILDRAESFHMPLVLYPSPKGATTVSTQFVRSWHEIAHRSCELDTYWNDDSALVGIAVTFGTEQRLFGSTAGERGASLHIEACEWIQEVRLLLSECNMFDESVDRSHYHSALNSRAQGNSQIEGMEVILTSGRTEVIKTGGRNTRTFVVLKDMYLIGLTGQIAPDGVISRFGFLQSYHPEHNPRAPRPSYNPAQTTLWGQSALHLPPGPESQPRVPIWDSSFYHLHTFTSGPRYDSADLPLDVLPHHVLLWSKTAETNKNLRGISAFVFEAGHVISGPDRWPIPDLLGFAAWHQAPHQDDTKPALQHVSQRVGTFNPVPAQSEEWNKCGYGAKRLDDNGNPLPPLNPSELDLGSKFQQFDTRFTQNFPIDGVNGECIQQIDVSTDFKAIKLITNQGRECYWGEQRRGQWYSRVASDEEFIAGLSVGFGRLGGWSWGAKMYSHWKVSEIGVIMGRRDGEKWV